MQGVLGYTPTSSHSMYFLTGFDSLLDTSSSPAAWEGSLCHVIEYNLIKRNPHVYSHVLRRIEPDVTGSAAELRAGITYSHHLEGIALSWMVQGL